ncbi:MAG TPA: TonB-dependent receptor plug domain-containing protein [Longimicrobiales bacterium]
MRTTSTLSLAVLLLCSCGGKSSPEQTPAPDKTGAVSTVSGAQLKGTTMRLDELLRGRAAGLDVITTDAGVVRLRIRGMGSINGDPEPLILVNNIEVPINALENALAGLTREDITEVRVLKDVASTSVYGMRGAGGVILIMTKR